MLAYEKNRYNALIQAGSVLRNYPNMPVWEALSAGQILSKKWLVEQLEFFKLSLGTTYIVGGWWGILPAMLFESDVEFDMIRSFDIDPSCAEIADTMNRPYVMDNWKFKAATYDMYEIDYSGRFVYEVTKFDGSNVKIGTHVNTVINTSCEHLEDFSRWWDKLPGHLLLVLQSNNFYSGTGHCNSVRSLEEFQAQAPLKHQIYAGELKLADYTRYMLIGTKDPWKKT